MRIVFDCPIRQVLVGCRTQVGVALVSVRLAKSPHGSPRRSREIGLVGVCAASILSLACTSSNSSSTGAAAANGGSGASNAYGGHPTTSVTSSGIIAAGGKQNEGGSNGSGVQSSTAGGAVTGGASQAGGARTTGETPAGTGGTRTGSTSHAGGAVSAGGANHAGGIVSSDSAAATGGRSRTGNATAQGGERPAGGANSTGGHGNAGGQGAPGGTTGAGGTTGLGGAAGASGATDSGGATSTTGPCDIYASGNTPCIAAHSTVRALLGAYDGNLYQVKRSSDSKTTDIGVLTPGGVANSATQDSFCSGTTCVITIVYDQSGHGNHLEYQGQGSSCGGQDKAATATTESLNVSGHKVYSLYINPGNSYWRDGHLTGVPTGKAPEGMYMVTSGTHVNSGCCFDYGNSETTRKADGAGAMDAIYFGTSCWFGGCSGTGPWVQADLEYGLFPGGSSSWNSKQVAFSNKYVTALLKNNGTTNFALKGGNAQSGSLTTLWDGSLPSGYNPMKKQGAIVLGSGGDCCATNTNLSQGTFYEGAIASGFPSDATDSAIQSNIVAAGYGR
jgi:non-reducing end alpha-L-arabinofuranosidase